MIWRASSREGARHRAYSEFYEQLREDEDETNLRFVLRKIYTTEHSEHKCGSLACARLRLTDHVLRT